MFQFVPQLLLLALVGLLPWSQAGRVPFIQDDGSQSTPAGQSESGGVLYLPIIYRKYPPPLPTYGVESVWYDNYFYDMAASAGTYWFRMAAFSWQDIEPVYFASPVYHWETVNENSLIAAAEKGLTPVVVVRFAPTWAQKVPGYPCGPIAVDRLDEFARFMQALVARYSVPPYNVKYWEIGNEPDVDPILVTPDSDYGCWGDENDAYYGGGYYADMLKQIYPAMKNADPQAKVVIGGLLLDCDPVYKPDGKECKPAKFLEGILANQGANYFDVVNFHGYPPYVNGTIYDVNHPSWADRGGVVLGKIKFLKEVMATYKVSKPILQTEGSLICIEGMEGCDPNSGDFSAFLEAQSDYVVWLYVRNIDAGVLGTVWYMLQGPSWRQSGMFDGDLNPKPVFEAYQFMIEILSGAEYLGRNYNYAGLDGYNFEKPGKKLLVLWAPDRTNHVITLPGKLQQIYDKYGNTITPVGGQLTVNSPVYLEIQP